MNISQKESTSELIKKRFSDIVIVSHSFRGDDTVIIKKEGIFEIFQYLKNAVSLEFDFLMDMTAVDRFVKEPRFEVVYHLYSSKHKKRIRVKTLVNEGESVDSLTFLWKAANWYEREIWDMFGIKFSGHPNLKRILMYESFEGHPLRKDYPVKKRQPIVQLRTDEI